jgi:hypothetical protein
MNKRIFLISEDTLKSETIINDNTGSEYIAPAIETSQDIYLQQLIGTELLDKLYNLIETGDISNENNVHYKILLDEYITNYLKFKVLSEITIPLAYKYRNVGVVQTNGTNIINTTMRDAGLVQNHYELRATFYADRMSKYLCTNAMHFQEYRSTRDAADIQANRDAYKTNWVL